MDSFFLTLEFCELPALATRSVFSETSPMSKTGCLVQAAFRSHGVFYMAGWICLIKDKYFLRGEKVTMVEGTMNKTW